MTDLSAEDAADTVSDILKGHKEEILRLQQSAMERIRLIECGRLKLEEKFEQTEIEYADSLEEISSKNDQLNTDLIESKSKEKLLIRDLKSTKKELSFSNQELACVRAELADEVKRSNLIKGEFEKSSADYVENLTKVSQRNENLTSELFDSKSKYQLLAQELESLKRDQEILNQNLIALEAEKSKMLVELASLEERNRRVINDNKIVLEEVNLKNDSLSMELVELKNQYQLLFSERMNLEKEILLLKNSNTLKLGRLIADSTQSGTEFLCLPIRMLRLWKSVRNQRRGKEHSQTVASRSERFESICQAARTIYADSGSHVVEQYLESQISEPRYLASAFTDLAKNVKDSDINTAVLFARKAAAIDPRSFREKWLAFLLFDSGDLIGASKILDSLPSDIRLNESESRKVQTIRSANNVELLTQCLEPVCLPQGKNSMTADEKAVFGEKLEQAVRFGGFEAVTELLKAQVENRSKRFTSFCELKAAMTCLNIGDVSGACKLAESSLGNDHSLGTIRGAVRVFYNACQLERAESLTHAMEEFEEKLTENDAKFISEIRGRLQLVALVKMPSESMSFTPKPKCVLNVLAFSLPYTSVGYATRSHGLAQGIQNAGWNICAYTRPGFPFDFKSELVGEGLPNEDVVDGVTYKRIFDFQRNDLSEVEYLSKAIEKFEQVIDQERPEIVHAASNYVTALPALVAARRKGVPFVYEVRGFWEVTRSSRDKSFENTAKFRFMQLFEELVSTYADRVITITSAMKEELIDRGVSADKISIAFNSVDPNRFEPVQRDDVLAKKLNIPAGIPVVGYVGSFVDYEGLDDLIAAAEGMKEAGLDFRMLLVGDGAIFESLKEQVEKMDLVDKVILTGRVPFEEVENYYSLIDIAPFPRKPWEVCELVSPLKPFEAMALEKAVVVSSTRALSEIVNNDSNGLIFQKGNVTSLTLALSTLIENPDLRLQLGKEARKWIVSERSWDVAGRVASDTYGIAAKVH